MFRNPVDMVYSFHSQLLYWSEETENDFEVAWRLQERRRMGLDVPRTCQEPFWLQYRDIGQFGTQTQRLLSVFPPEQVKLILFDDLATSPNGYTTRSLISSESLMTTAASFLVPMKTRELA